ncbi:DUF4266 domain-containing protein [Spongiimicrobium salis]|uniref:DUF4266 domain-containing protein n=1 Tax=Spongiimicrobium salis TaxID=1667022 RepID=UPI00374D978E
MKKLALIFFLALFSSSCVAVKEYEKVYLNDEEMLLSARGMERFETNFQIYREASSGANGGKTGGGCGCNLNEPQEDCPE